jgi:hypothetical protein
MRQKNSDKTFRKKANKKLRRSPGSRKRSSKTDHGGGIMILVSILVMKERGSF